MYINVQSVSAKSNFKWNKKGGKKKETNTNEKRISAYLEYLIFCFLFEALVWSFWSNEAEINPVSQKPIIIAQKQVKKTMKYSIRLKDVL